MAIETLPSIAATGPAAGEEFAELEAKIHRIAEGLRAARGERDHALASLRQLQAAHDKLQHEYAQAEVELAGFRKERTEVLQRVSRLAKQLDAAGE